MKSKSKIVLTSAVAGAMAMGAVTGVILPTSAHALDLPGSINTSTSSSTSTPTNNDASGGVLANSTTKTNAASTGADTDTRMRQATSRQSGSRGSLLDNTTGVTGNVNAAGVGATVNTDTTVDTDDRFRNAESRISGTSNADATPSDTAAGAATDATATSESDVDADGSATTAIENQADTDARMRDAESRMSGSRGSLQSDTTAGSDPNAELRAQIRDTSTDAKAGISTEANGEDDDDLDATTERSGGLQSMTRGSAGVNTDD